jgi:phosphate transport system protein
MLPNFEQKANEIKKDIISMGEFILHAFEESLEGIKTNNIEKLVSSREGNIKHLSYMADSVDNNVIVALALYGPEASELRNLIAMMKSTNELTRIADGFKKYVRGMEEVMASDFNVGNLKVKDYVIDLHTISINSIKLVVDCFKDFSMDAYRAIHIEEEKSDEVFSVFQKEILSNPPSEQEKMMSCIKIVRILKKHERITDHCENIAKLVYFANEGGKLTSRL